MGIPSDQKMKSDTRFHCSKGIGELSQFSGSVTIFGNIIVLLLLIKMHDRGLQRGFARRDSR